ncbi:alpha-galactosidase [soil metagenome]
MSGDERPQVIVIEAGRTGLVLAVSETGGLHQIAFGADVAARRPELPVWLYPVAYPTFGEEVLREPALRVTQEDGVTSTRLQFASATVGVHEHGATHRVAMVDRVAPLAVTLCFRTWPEHDLLEQWVEITNHGTGEVTVHQASASAASFSGKDPHLTHWGGGWASEWQETTERLTPGTKVVASAGGVRSSLHREPIVLFAPDGPAGETSGQVGACTVIWGGDTRFDAEVFKPGQQRLIAGQQGRGAERVLAPGDEHASASVGWVWSDAGIGPTSRALHDFARRHVVRGGTSVRARVVNTWEAVFFDLDPAGLAAQVDRAADIGGELFLLDDGWFGSAFPRNDDTTSLGDWAVDRSKLPDGLQPLIDHTLERGLRFGLWVEPEMVNPVSELYRAHPDWVIAEPGRERRQERNQLVLDVLRPEVREFVIDVVDRVLTEHPGISYLKWDANRDVTEPWSATLDERRQSHLAMDRVRATWSIMEEVERRHPHVELMLCASGGGRTDLGTLRWFNEVWTSDDTDPVDRVRIQWGATHLLPASVVAAHVTRLGGHPFAFGCAVALSGRFGFDVDLRSVTESEWAIGREAVQTDDRTRDLVQQGDLHRLVSPVGTERAALAYVSPQGDRSVVFLYRLPGDAEPGADLELGFLDPTARYRVEDLTPGLHDGERGRDLAATSVGWPTGTAPVASVLEIVRIG